MDSIRLRGPSDILAALPYQLGYHPRDALVVVALRGRAIGLVQRLDLPPPELVDDALDALLPALVREKPDAVLLVGYEPEAGASMAMLDALGDAATAHGIGVLDRLVVRDGRWFAPDCDDECCPAEGTPLAGPEDTPAVADFVGLEMAAVPDRGSLADQVAPDERVCREVTTAIAAAVASWESDERATAVRRLRWLSVWAVVCDVSAARPPLEGLSAEELAALALSLRDVALRDGLIGWVCPGTLPLDALDEDLVDQLRSSLPDQAWAVQPATRESVVAGRRLSSRLAHLCRVVPELHAAPMLTVLANFTWWLGDGALTRTALERALEIEPDYRLALLLERMVDLAIRPRLSA
jgi:Domain of unknown function (DUF4192)